MSSSAGWLVIQENVNSAPTTVPDLIGQLCLTLGGIYRWDGTEWNLIGASSPSGVTLYNNQTGAVLGLTVYSGSGGPPSSPTPPNGALAVNLQNWELYIGNNGLWMANQSWITWEGGLPGLQSYLYETFCGMVNNVRGINAYIVYGEIPTGSIDGTNKVFTLAHTPTLASTGVGVSVYYAAVDGTTSWVAPTQYTLATNAITFGTAPTDGGTLYVDYTWTTADLVPD